MSDPLDNDWIDAVHAVQLALRRSGQPLTKQILERARDGVIRSRAKHYLVKGPTRRGPPGTQSVEKDETLGFCKLPPEFFWAAGGEALEANWSTGDFSTWIDSTWHCRAYGVQFLRADIEEMSPNLGHELEPAKSSLPLKKHTDSELEQWIRAAPTINADDALNFYKLDPRYNGIKQTQFRELWKTIKGTHRGAQKKSKS